MSVNITLILLFIVLNVTGFLVFRKLKEKWKVLLFFSVLFYFFITQWATLLIFLLSLIIFFGARFIEKTKSPMVYYAVVALSLVALLIQKLQFIPDNIPSETFSVLGLSYITFNALSYIFDIRKGYIKAEKNYWLLLLYLFYFPYISAGPLHRYKRTISQFTQKVGLTNENFSAGLRLILWGIFKNLVLAQRLKRIVDTIIDNPETYHGFMVIIGGATFFVYLYCDFSSYIDIIGGTSRIFGIELSINFRNRIYASTSRKHFWEGWHITLNHWFRDYVFYPLAKRAKNKWWLNLSILSTFILIGLWHEISLRFLLWGLINGLWIITENEFRGYFAFGSERVRNILGGIYHISIASFLAIIFRTKNLHASIDALFSQTNFSAINDLSLHKQMMYIVPLFILMDYFYRKAAGKPINEYLGTLSLRSRWAIYLLLTIIILTLGEVQIDEAYYIQF